MRTITATVVYSVYVEITVDEDEEFGTGELQTELKDEADRILAMGDNKSVIHDCSDEDLIE